MYQVQQIQLNLAMEDQKALWAFKGSVKPKNTKYVQFHMISFYLEILHRIQNLIWGNSEQSVCLLFRKLRLKFLISEYRGGKWQRMSNAKTTRTLPGQKKKQELHLDLTKLIIEWFICLVWQQVIQPHLMQWDASQAGKHALQWWNNVPQFQTAQQVCRNC